MSFDLCQYNVISFPVSRGKLLFSAVLASGTTCAQVQRTGQISVGIQKKALCKKNEKEGLAFRYY